MKAFQLDGNFLYSNLKNRNISERKKERIARKKNVESGNFFFFGFQDGKKIKWKYRKKKDCIERKGSQRWNVRFDSSELNGRKIEKKKRKRNFNNVCHQRAICFISKWIDSISSLHHTRASLEPEWEGKKKSSRAQYCFRAPIIDSNNSNSSDSNFIIVNHQVGSLLLFTSSLYGSLR